jgi:uncharacterized membrane protein YfcA
VDWSLLGSLLLGSLAGILVGSSLATRVPERALRTILAATLALVGTRMAISHGVVVKLRDSRASWNS